MKTQLMIVGAMVLTLSGCGKGPITTDTDSIVDPTEDAGTDAPPVKVCECPALPVECYETSCLNGSCLVVPAKAGKACNKGSAPSTCDGAGNCGMATCDADTDCAAKDPCLAATCAKDGPLANVCAHAPVSDGECSDPCAPVIRGPEYDACAPKNEIGFHCEREGGPSVGVTDCYQPNAATQQDTWCCVAKGP